MNALHISLTRLRRACLYSLVAGSFYICWVSSTDAQAAIPSKDVDAVVSAASTFESGQNLTALRRIEVLVVQSTADLKLRRLVETSLARLIQTNATFEAKRFACQQLMIIGSDTSLTALANLLKNHETAGIACLAIGKRPSEKANQILRASLPGLRGLARLQVITALGDREDARSPALLAKLANDPEAIVAEAAITALGKIATKPALATLAALRKTGNPALNRVVVEASLCGAEKLVAAGDHPAAVSIYEELLQSNQSTAVRRGALSALLRLDRDGGDKRIQDLLRGAESVLKPIAIAGIADLRSSDVSEKFGRLLPLLAPAEQVWLIDILAARGDEPALSAIIGQLSSSNTIVRLAAIGAVGVIGNEREVAALINTLRKVQAAEEGLAINLALGSLRGGEKTDQAILDELNRSSAEIKSQLISTLVNRRSPRAMPALLNESQSANAMVAKAAFRALGRLATSESLPLLIEQLSRALAPEVRVEAEDAIFQVMEKVQAITVRVEIVGKALAGAVNPEARCSLIRLLPGCANAQSLALLKTACANAEPAIKDAAIRTLAIWPDSLAWDLLAGIYHQPETEFYRALALRGLVRLTKEENARPNAVLIAHYRELLAGAQNDDDRKLILGALAGAAHPDALPLAQSLAGIPGVRAEAELAVERISGSLRRRK